MSPIARQLTSNAGDYTGKSIRLRFMGEPLHVQHLVTLIDYDAVGMRVKDSSGGSPSETKFHLWHMIAAILP
jgi:hypothetical protein